MQRIQDQVRYQTKQLEVKVVTIAGLKTYKLSLFDLVVNCTADVDTPDFCGTAVTEAKKWLKERRLGSSSKSDSDHGTCTLNSLMFPQVSVLPLVLSHGYHVRSTFSPMSRSLSLE